MWLQMVADWCSYKLTVGFLAVVCLDLYPLHGMVNSLFIFTIHQTNILISIRWLKQDGQRLIHSLCVYTSSFSPSTLLQLFQLSVSGSMKSSFFRYNSSPRLNIFRINHIAVVSCH
jgi:hypothetical protein